MDPNFLTWLYVNAPLLPCPALSIPFALHYITPSGFDSVGRLNGGSQALADTDSTVSFPGVSTRTDAGGGDEDVMLSDGQLGEDYCRCLLKTKCVVGVC